MSNDPSSEFVYKPAKSKRPEDAIAPVDKSLSVPKQIMARYAQAERIIESWPVIHPTDAEQSAYDALYCVAGENGQSEGVRLAEPLRTRERCVAAILGALVVSGTWDGVRQRTGIEFLPIDLAAKWDKAGFGELLRRAEAQRDRRIVDKLRGAVVSRAVDGVDEPIVGRIGKDQDGIIGHKRRHSDKLAEFALSRLDRGTFGEQPASVNVGQQVVYNIHALQINADTAKPAEKMAEDVKAGENPAIIDMDSIGSLEE